MSESNSIYPKLTAFRCQHKKLTKKKYSHNIYSCINCNKEFTVIPCKNIPIYPVIPEQIRKPPSFPDEKYW